MMLGVNTPPASPSRRHVATRWSLISALAVFGFAIAFSPSCHSTSNRHTAAPPYYEPVAPLPEPMPSIGPEIRIRIATELDRVDLAGPPRVSLIDTRDPRNVASLRTPVAAERTAGGFRVIDASGAVRTFNRDAALRFDGEGSQSTLLTVNSAPFPGAIFLYPSESSPARLDVIEETSVELYLPGVVSKELYAAWSDVAFDAQAIAARTYALHERARSRAAGRHFDLEGSTLDQAYAGADVNARAVRSVRRTRGLTVIWQGELLRTYYSSTCGGRAAGAADTWPTTFGFEFNLADPIQATPRRCACEFSPLFRWSVQRPTADLARRIAAFGEREGLAVRAIRSISAIRAERTNAVVRPVSYKVFDDSGRWWSMSAEQLRVACNTSVPGLPNIERATRISSGDLEVHIADGVARFEGRGFGHGVGLCQFGAEGLARAGADPIEILRLFYPNSRIDRAY
ncbi:MAG: SpoIID/LytB domain-containing protein [Planctomycetota bacterium]|nr:SpoIID/LytB domain-containing protein [Planctomycetota bacterium]